MVKRIGAVCGVYVARNLVNGHVSVGSSLSCKWRIESHKYGLRRQRHPNSYFQAAWNKYGEASFEWSVLETCEPSKRFKCEQKWIEKLRANEAGYGYNFMFPVKGKAPSKRMSDKHKEYWAALEGVARDKRIRHMTDPNGLPKSNSRSMKALWQEPEFREKRLAGLTVGRNKTNAVVTETCRSILSEGRAIAITRNKTPEARAKQRKNALKQYKDPVMKELRLDSLLRGRITQHKTALERKGLLGSCDCHLCVGQ